MSANHRMENSLRRMEFSASKFLYFKITKAAEKSGWFDQGEHICLEQTLNKSFRLDEEGRLTVE